MAHASTTVTAMAYGLRHLNVNIKQALFALVEAVKHRHNYVRRLLAISSISRDNGIGVYRRAGPWCCCARNVTSALSLDHFVTGNADTFGIDADRVATADLGAR